MTDYLIVGDQLPTVWDCVNTIWIRSSTFDSDKQNQLILRLCESVLEHWSRVFPKHLLISVWGARDKLKLIMKNYFLLQRVKKDREIRLQEFKSESKTKVMDLLKKEYRNKTEKLEFELQSFYLDQCNERKLTMEDVDLGFVDLNNNVKQNESESDCQMELDQELDSSDETVMETEHDDSTVLRYFTCFFRYIYRLMIKWM